MCGVLVGPFPEFFFFFGQGIPSGGKRIWSVWSVIEKKKSLGCGAHDFALPVPL